ncbi:hypothetical protein V5799_031661, partial [Amblyomma americanum]
AQLLLVFLAAKAYGLHHHTTAAGYPGPGFGGYAAPVAANAYRGYADYASPPQPYSFGYDNVDEYGNRQFRSEQGDSSNAKTGSYGYRDAYGLYRRVNYVADANGFRATVDTNEPGTAPVPESQGLGFLLHAYGARGVTSGYNNAYAGHSGYGYGPYGGAAAGFGRVPYAGYGYTSGSGALGGYGYGGYPQYGYGGAGYQAGRYGPAPYGGANGWAAGQQGFRRR